MKQEVIGIDYLRDRKKVGVDENYSTNFVIASSIDHILSLGWD